MQSQLEADEMRALYRVQYREWWKTLFAGLGSGEDGFGLFGPTSYLLHVGGLKLAIDPCFRTEERAQQVGDLLESDLARLDLILLSHEHADHLDPHFIRRAAKAPVRWIVPDFFAFDRLHEWGLPESRIIRWRAGQCGRFGGVTLSAFESVHRNEGASGFLRELGYVLEYGGRRFVFPGDVRNYDPAPFSAFSSVDVLFSHLWLGKDCALQPPWEPKLSEFCRFALSFHPAKISIAHLYELGRTPQELWTLRHAGAAAERLHALSPETAVLVPMPGEWNLFN